MGLIARHCHGALLQTWHGALLSQKCKLSLSLSHYQQLLSWVFVSLVLLLFKRIIADMKEAAWGQNSRFLPAVANRQRLYVCSLLSGAWKPDEFAEPSVLWMQTRLLSVVYPTCCTACVTISVLGPFLSVPVGPLSVRASRPTKLCWTVPALPQPYEAILYFFGDMYTCFMRLYM